MWKFQCFLFVMKQSYICYYIISKTVPLSEHVEFCSSTPKNIMPPLPQCLWPPKFTGWWFTMTGSPHDLIFTWSCGITWQTKNFISPLPQCQCPLKLASWQIKYLTLYLTRDKLNTLYLHYRDAYKHQTWQGSDLPLGASTLKVAWPFENVVLLDGADFKYDNSFSKF